jgi:hypothetical protein
MRLNVTAVAASSAILWALAMFVTGLANMIWPPYGQAFLQVMDSIYPGYQATASFGQVIVGSLYGLVDAAVGGAVFAWLYNVVAARSSTARQP